MALEHFDAMDDTWYVGLCDMGLDTVVHGMCLELGMGFRELVHGRTVELRRSLTPDQE